MNQWEILAFLKEHKGESYSVRELVEVLHCEAETHRNLNKQINQLAKHKFITINKEYRTYMYMRKPVKTVQYKEPKGENKE